MRFESIEGLWIWKWVVELREREREREIYLFGKKKVRVEDQIGRPLIWLWLWLWVQMDLGFAVVKRKFMRWGLRVYRDCEFENEWWNWVRTEFLFWAYDFFFELNFFGFLVCLFLKKIYGDEPKEYEHVLQKKIMKEIKFFNLIILFYFKRILKKWKKLLCQQCTPFATSAFSVN